MGADLFQLGTVTLGLTVLLVFPFLPAASILVRQGQWPGIMLTAAILGCCSQAVLGLIWSHLVGKWPYAEVAVLGAFWLFSLYWSYNRYKAGSEIRSDPRDKQYHMLLVLILFSAFLVRSMHPLEAAYLGQSDAYTHLHYLHGIVDRGHLHNPVYPPGYHWILALPVLVFSIDPYVVTRFAGAFFGIALVLAVYVLLDQLFSRRAAVLGSFCAACFPPMTLLMKTGVGAFANQLGLLLVPGILFFYVRIISGREKGRGAGFLFLLSLCALAAAVPMMLLHVLLIMSLERLIIVPRAPRLWFSKTVRIALLILPAVCLLLFHFNQVGPGQRFQTATILMDYSGKKQPIVEQVTAKVREAAGRYDPAKRKVAMIIADSPYTGLLIDYFTVKRYGFGNVYLNTLGWMLLGIFFGFSGYGLITAKSSFLVIGLWGGLTTIQAATGFLQFSSYQREGWSLLVATCCMSGMLAAWFFQLGAKSQLFRFGVVLLMGFSFLWAVRYPPRHPAIQSGAEDLLVRSIRFFGQGPVKLSAACKLHDDSLCRVADFLLPDLPLTLVTRRFIGWGNQGEILPNILQKGTDVRSMTIGNGQKDIAFKDSGQFLVLIDKKNKLSGRQVISAFAMVTPEMVTATLRQQNYLFRANTRILEYMENLSGAEWQVHRVPLSATLTAFVVTPLNSRVD